MKEYQQMNSENSTIQTSSESSNTVLSDEKPSIEALNQLILSEKEHDKLCCLCNLGERSSLGQGDILQIKSIDGVEKCTELDTKKADESADKIQTVGMEQFSPQHQKKTKTKTSFMLEFCNELDKVGYSKLITIDELYDDITIYVHRMCAMWSLGCSFNAGDEATKLKSIVASSLERKCAFCKQYGASVVCQNSCSNVFHMPCAAASGCFLLMGTFTVICVNHCDEVAVICAEKNVVCRQCFDVGDISKLIMCSTCGDHYHTNCVGIANLPDTKCGWNCYQCIKCQICRAPEISEGRSIRCEHCQKLYHASCLRPVIASIPKLGWKCNRCRVCTDCGSRTPGSGTSSRWHCHYSVCDSCYQQRNKGFSCPMCHKAYRAAAYKEMVKCSSCNRFVHGSCDNQAELSVYHIKKESNPDYDYICPNCISFQTRCNAELTSLLAMEAFLPEDGSQKISYFEGFKKNASTDSSKIYNALKLSKKRVNFKDNQRCRRDKLMLQRTSLAAQFGRKRSARGKSHQTFSACNMFDRNNHNDYDMTTEKKILLCSVKDKFILSQDLCVMCGSLGIEQDGCLIACSQCGQCYHPYCVSIKLSKVMVEKGWRCIDCIVCEGCGQKNDEARLTLCDECDISYHIYCMVPPLETVPHGSWKCKWCAVCQKCGRKPLNFNLLTQNGVKECAVCASQEICHVCTQEYKDGELIIQCNSCDRWLHYQCDSFLTNGDEHIYSEYQCLQCRPNNQITSQQNCLAVVSKTDTDCKPFPNNATNASNLPTQVFKNKSCTDMNLYSACEANNSNGSKCLVDGIYVTQMGLDMIKSITTEIKRKRKLRMANDVPKKDFGVLDAIESVVAASSTITSTEGEDGDESKKEIKNHPEEIIWRGTESRPPEGFSVYTNEEGVVILRKKRQRNLQKMGIGGFNIRNRALKKDGDENGHIASVNASIQLEVQKKKKIVRKKFKSKLIETYPAYLQEAFFGNSLLGAKQTTNSNLCASESSNERSSLKGNPLCKKPEPAVELQLTNTNANTTLPKQT